MNNILNLSPALRNDVQRLVNQISNSKILSSTSLNRLNKLVSLLDAKGYINYAEAYRHLFPKSTINSKEKEKSDKAFSKFRTKLRTVTEKHQMPLVLCVDDNKTSENSTRCLWFECEDNDVKQRIESHNKNYTYNLPIPMEYQKISIGNRKFPAENEQAIPFLVDWLNDPDGDVFYTVLGEKGMGKTTLCQQLTKTLMDDRKQETTLTIPIYFDLREVNWDWNIKGVPALDIIIKLAQECNLPVDEAITVDDIKRLIQRQRTLIVFDGIDEVMNCLTPEQIYIFIEELSNILPSTAYNHQQEENIKKTHGRLMFTCRSHFFKTVEDQFYTLGGQQCERDCKWVTLLPLNGDQVENYLHEVFTNNQSKADFAISMLDENHNLRELSTLPYNMKLIQDRFDKVESLQLEDKKVIVADLYEWIVIKWLQRDKPKQSLSLDHKLVLMESLALLLWKEQKKHINYVDLENLLLDQILENKRWSFIYQGYLNKRQGLDVLQQDLRNASFLVSHDDNSFRFCHTSIMEFFLARALSKQSVKPLVSTMGI